MPGITLGIDPGTAILGYGVVRGDRDPELVTYGVVRTESGLAPEKRLQRLYDAVSRLIAEHCRMRSPSSNSSFPRMSRPRCR